MIQIERLDCLAIKRYKMCILIPYESSRGVILQQGSDSDNFGESPVFLAYLNQELQKFVIWPFMSDQVVSYNNEVNKCPIPIILMSRTCF